MKFRLIYSILFLALFLNFSPLWSLLKWDTLFTCVLILSDVLKQNQQWKRLFTLVACLDTPCSVLFNRFLVVPQIKWMNVDCYSQSRFQNMILVYYSGRLMWDPQYSGGKMLETCRLFVLYEIQVSVSYVIVPLFSSKNY